MAPLAIELGLGVLLAAALILLARRLQAEKRHYGVVLLITAAYYVVAALLKGRTDALPLELGGLALFGVLGLLGMSRPILLVLGWAGHVLWDVLFHTGGQGGYVPDWYPMLCVGFDLFLAGYIAGRFWTSGSTMAS